MDEILSEMLEGGKARPGFGKASTAIWILNLPVEMKARFGDMLAKLFLEMSREELHAVKNYVQFTTWANCPELLDQLRVPGLPK